MSVTAASAGERSAWSERAAPALSCLPRVRHAMEKGRAVDPQRGANPWHRAERTWSGVVVQAIESWRVVRDQWAELAFERLYAS